MAPRICETGGSVPNALRDALTAHRIRLNTLQSRAADDEVRRLTDVLIDSTTPDELRKSATQANPGEPDTAVQLIQRSGQLVRESFGRLRQPDL